MQEQGLIFAAADWSSALRCFDGVDLIRVGDDRNQFFRGFTLGKLDRYEEAIAAYEAAIAINPDKHEAFYNKGVALSALGRKEEAIAAYDAALAIVPHDASTHYNKACTYALLSQLNDALTFLQKAIELDGTNEYIELAKTDSDFDAMRDRPQFQALITQHEEIQHIKE